MPPHMNALKKSFFVVLGVALGLFISQLSLIARLDDHVLLQAQNTAIRDGPRNRDGLNPCSNQHRQLWPSQPLPPPLNASLRYRHLSKELAPRRLVLVGVVTAHRFLDTRARGIYRTWGKDVTLDVLFFTGTSQVSDGASATELPVVSLAGVDDDQYPPQRKVFAMLRHMFEHHIDTYDFFMRADDDVYVKSDGLRVLLQSVNPAQDIYMGSPGFGRERDQDRIRLGRAGVDRYCMGGPGVIFSRSALRRLGPHLNECLSNVVVSYNEDVEVGRCVHRVLNVQCTWAWETLWLFWTDYNSTLTTDKLYGSEEVKFALTLHPIKDPSVMVQVHLYLQQLRVQSLLGEAAAVQSELVRTARHLPAKANRFGNRDWLWYRAGLNPQSRHALVTWGYFNSSVLFSTCSRFSVSNLPLSHVAGVNMALEVLLSAMEADGCGPFSPPYQLDEGFVAQDPSSGVSYMLAVTLQKTHPSPRAVRYVARVFLPLLGPGLAHYQLATEPLGTLLHVVVAVAQGDHLDRFLRMYYQVCLKRKTATHLHLVFLNNATRSSTLEELIQSYSKSVTCYHADELSIMDATSLVAKSLSDHTQLLLMRPDLAFTSEFLDHCRLNTVRGKQVFFPVPFSLYTTAKYLAIPNHTPSSGDAGFFLHHSYEVACVYTSDYLAYAGPLTQTKLQLVDQLVSSNLYVMRALEPYLFRPFEYGRCSKLDGQQKKDCIIAQVEAIGSRRLLSSLVAASYQLDWI